MDAYLAYLDATLPVSRVHCAEWNINDTDIDTKETVRRDLAARFPELVKRQDYEIPLTVTLVVAGADGEARAMWNSWLSMPYIGVIAFIARNENGSDGETVYRW